MRRRKAIRTTLGELIVALTDEAREFVSEPSDAYRLVSCILSDMAARKQLRFSKRAAHEPSLENESTREKAGQRLAG